MRVDDLWPGLPVIVKFEGSEFCAEVVSVGIHPSDIDSKATKNICTKVKIVQKGYMHDKTINLPGRAILRTYKPKSDEVVRAEQMKALLEEEERRAEQLERKEFIEVMIEMLQEFNVKASLGSVRKASSPGTPEFYEYHLIVNDPVNLKKLIDHYVTQQIMGQGDK